MYILVVRDRVMVHVFLNAYLETRAHISCSHFCHAHICNAHLESSTYIGGSHACGAYLENYKYLYIGGLHVCGAYLENGAYIGGLHFSGWCI